MYVTVFFPDDIMGTEGFFGWIIHISVYNFFTDGEVSRAHSFHDTSNPLYLICFRQGLRTLIRFLISGCELMISLGWLFSEKVIFSPVHLELMLYIYKKLWINSD